MEPSNFNPVPPPPSDDLSIVISPDSSALAPLPDESPEARVSLRKAAPKKPMTTIECIDDKIAQMQVKRDDITAVSLKFKRESDDYASLDSNAPVNAKLDDQNYFVFDVKYEITAGHQTFAVEQKIYTNVKIPHPIIDPDLPADEFAALVAENEKAKQMALTIAVAYGSTYSKAYTEHDNALLDGKLNALYLTFGTTAGETQESFSKMIQSHNFKNINVYFASNNPTDLLEIDLIGTAAKVDDTSTVIFSLIQALRETPVIVTEGDYPEEVRELEKQYAQGLDTFDPAQVDYRHFLPYIQHQNETLQNEFNQLARELDPSLLQGLWGKVKDLFKNEETFVGKFGEVMKEQANPRIKTLESEYEVAKAKYQALAQENTTTKDQLEAAKREMEDKEYLYNKELKKFRNNKAQLLDLQRQMEIVQKKLTDGLLKVSKMHTHDPTEELGEYLEGLDKKLKANEETLKAVKEKFASLKALKLEDKKDSAVAQPAQEPSAARVNLPSGVPAASSGPLSRENAEPAAGQEESIVSEPNEKDN